MSSLRRGALVFGVLALLLFADGIYLVATHKNPNGDTGTFFGNSSYYLNAGTVVVLSGVLVLVASVVMWLVDVHRQDKQREQRPAGSASAGEQPGPADRTVSHAPAADPPTSEPARQSGRTASKA
jgi:hypothetical protein